MLADAHRAVLHVVDQKQPHFEEVKYLAVLDLMFVQYHVNNLKFFSHSPMKEDESNRLFETKMIKILEVFSCLLVR